MDNQSGSTVDVQPGTGAGSENPTLQDPANIDPTSDQAQADAIGDEQIGPDSLPPELEETRKQLLRDYHQKTQRLAEERGRLSTELDSHKQKSEMLDKLMTKNWFIKAQQDEMARLSGGGTFEVPDEKFEAVRNGDKQAFMEIVKGMAQTMLNSQVGPALGAQQETLADIQVNRELDQALAAYPEIQDLIDQDNPDFMRWADEYGYETAYQKFVFANGQRGSREDSGPSPEELANQSRAGSVARGGMVQARGSKVLKAKNFDEAFDQAFAAIQRGEKDFTFERG